MQCAGVCKILHILVPTRRLVRQPRSLALIRRVELVEADHAGPLVTIFAQRLRAPITMVFFRVGHYFSLSNITILTPLSAHGQAHHGQATG